jgi:hypothetical protein
VTLDPAILLRGNTVLDLSSAEGRTEIELELENGFRGRGGSSSGSN